VNLRAARCAAICALLLAGADSQAHTRSVSYSSWEIGEGRARVQLRIAQLELTRLPWGPVSPPQLPPRLADYLVESLQLRAGAARCTAAAPRALSAPRGRAVIEWRLQCPAGALSIESALLLDVAPGHLHFARLRGPDGAVSERVLSNAARRWTLPTAAAGTSAAAGTADSATGGSSIARYGWLGVQHIATGYDHLVFLLGLLLLAASLREVAVVVTGFTLAHSITLGLAASGRLAPDAAAVESLIGFSIALVAAENSWRLSGGARAVPAAVVAALLAAAALAAFGVGAVSALTLAGLALFCGCYFALLRRLQPAVALRPWVGRLRFAIAFGFGLVHGFGFAGVLAELALPPERLLPALLGFNLGVELGQLAALALCWPLLRILTRSGAGRPLLEAGSALICALGVFWMLSRAYA